MKYRDFVTLLHALGFAEVPSSGSHRRFAHRSARHMVIQAEGAFAKGYQVRQLLKLIDEYNLDLG